MKTRIRPSATICLAISLLAVACKDDPPTDAPHTSNFNCNVTTDQFTVDEGDGGTRTILASHVCAQTFAYVDDIDARNHIGRLAPFADNSVSLPQVVFVFDTSQAPVERASGSITTNSSAEQFVSGYVAGQYSSCAANASGGASSTRNDMAHTVFENAIEPTDQLWQAPTNSACCNIATGQTNPSCRGYGVIVAAYQTRTSMAFSSTSSFNVDAGFSCGAATSMTHVTAMASVSGMQSNRLAIESQGWNFYLLENIEFVCMTLHNNAARRQ